MPGSESCVPDLLSEHVTESTAVFATHMNTEDTNLSLQPPRIDHACTLIQVVDTGFSMSHGFWMGRDLEAGLK